MKRICTGARVLPLLAAALLAAPAAGQSARVRVEENFRTEPNGTVIGVVQPGVSLAEPSSEDRWVEATLEGWMWSQSLQMRDGGAYDLVVSASDGENLRDAPSGEIVARLEEGTLFEELERRPGWIRVRRRAWIWGASVEVEQESAAADAPVAQPSVARPAATTAEPRVLSTGALAPALLTAPDGDTLARLAPGSDLAVTSREGNWVRVRLEGWVWSPSTGEASVPTDDVVLEVTPEDVSRDPEAHRGRLVRWELQFISLERAERIRTDFYEGEPFLLARPEGGDGAFVYVAVSPERLPELDGLLPLERIVVLGRIRAGASALTGSPILDLVELLPPGR